jgi:hypothetical protein
MAWLRTIDASGSISRGRFGPTIKEPNDEDEIPAGSFAARTRDVSYRSGENDGT